MTSPRRPLLLTLLTVAALTALPSVTHAWAHTGHILISRMAALRIINDPVAPQGLKDFLKTNMKYDLEACRKMAVEEYVGVKAENYLAGLDGAVTLPDRIQHEDEGKKNIEPYGAPEEKMHYTDLEWLGKDPAYKPDLSNKVKLADVPRDVKDPRWKMAGFAPFRIEEHYKKLVAEFAKDKLDNDETLRVTGYLLHYIEDAHQPHHSTIDFKSFSYLAGKIKEVKEIKKPTADGGTSVSYYVSKENSKAFNPHGAMEFQLFENTQEPRKTLREQYWKEFTERIDKKSKIETERAYKFGTFEYAYSILSNSYDYLPAVGKATLAGYATGEFNPEKFFNSEDTVKGQKMTILQLIADRNATAVLEVEQTLRTAWADAHPTPK
jgi:hypothetical protein